MKDRSEGGLGNEKEMREKVFERERDEILVGGEERESRDELSTLPLFSLENLSRHLSNVVYHLIERIQPLTALYILL